MPDGVRKALRASAGAAGRAARSTRGSSQPLGGFDKHSCQWEMSSTMVNETYRRPPPMPSHTAWCKHRWLIDTPNGPLVHGHCKLCGAERDFPTVPEPLAFGTLHERAR